MASDRMAASQGILYACLADMKGNVMTECQRTRQGTIQMNAKRVLQSIPKKKAEKRSYTFNEHSYDIIFDTTGQVFLSVSDENFNRVRAFQFLEDAKKKYAQVNRDTTAFGPELKVLAEYYSDVRNDKLQTLKENIDGVKGVMIENIDRVLERGERIDAVVERTDELAQRADEFKKQSARVKRKMMCRRIMYWCFGIFLLLLIAFIVLLFACSKDGLNFDKCFGSSDKKQ